MGPPQTLFMFLGQFMVPALAAVDVAILLRAVLYREPWLLGGVLLYALWLFRSRNMPEDSKNRIPVWAGLRTGIWRHLPRYFPVTVHHSRREAFRGDEVYLFGYHPHGVLSYGAVLSSGFVLDRWYEETFGAANVLFVTISLNLWIPLWRELVMACGMISASAKSIRGGLQHLRERRGGALTIVVGGGRESLDTRPGRMDLTLRCRRGIFRIALQQRTPVVPVVGFGENELYEEVRGNRVIAILQAALLKTLGCTFPFMVGRGLLGLLPGRRPIDVVIGEPIHIARQVAHPTDAEVEALQGQYEAALVALWNGHRDRFGFGSVEMRMVR